MIEPENNVEEVEMDEVEVTDPAVEVEPEAPAAEETADAPSEGRVRPLSFYP
jgi:hypothetical protein